MGDDVTERVRVLEGRTLSRGRGGGRALVLRAPLSFWGGTEEGRIVDAHHPQVGEEVAERVLVLPSGRGSSSSSSVLAEAIRAGTAPVAILLLRPDPIIALGAVVADELYGRAIPVGVLPADAYERLRSGMHLVVEADDERTVVRIA